MILTELKNALKEEFSAWYGYNSIKDFLSGPYAKELGKFYLTTGDDELEDHAYWLMKRISEFEGNIKDITNTPASWLSAKHPYLQPVWTKNEDGILVVDTKTSIETNIKNEEGAIQTYKKIIKMTDDVDDVTCKKCKDILKDEEDHLESLKEFLNKINKG